MRKLFSKNVLFFLGIGTVLFAAVPYEAEAKTIAQKTITQENGDKDIEQVPVAPIKPTIDLESNENQVESSESLEVAAVSSEALGEIEPISVESYLSTSRHSESSPQASTILLQDVDFALVTPEDVSSQRSGLFTAHDWTSETLEPNGEILGDRGDRHWLIAQESLELESDLDSESLPEPLDEEMSEDEVVNEESETRERPWTFQFSPYVFIPLNVRGDSTVEGVTANVDLGLDDILDFFVFGASGRFEAWHRNRFGIIFDGVYAHLGTEDQRVFEGPRGLLRLDVEAEVNYEQAMFDLGFGYRTEIDDGNDNNRATLDGVPDGLFDIIAGIRVQYLRQTIDLDFALSGPNRTFRFDRELGTDDVWVEPLLGARVRYNFSRKLGLISRADFSGLGINGLSFTWRFLGGIDWVFAGDTSLSAGYSVLGIDYKTGEGRDEFGIDQVQHGPFFALTFRF